MAETPEYFDNVTVGQYAMTGIPLKVYVGGQYLTITDPDDVENPLIGFGMSSNGEMIQFDYKQVEHLLVSGNVVDLETYKKAMEDDDKEEEGEEEEGEEEDSEKDDEEGEEGEEGGDDEEEESEEEKDDEEGGANPFESVMPSLASLVEITKDVKKAREKALDAEEDAIKDKRKALDDEPITDGVVEARGRAGEELSMISKSRAKASLRQIKKGKRDDGMGKFDAKLYGVDASGEEHEITDEDEINIYKKFGLRAIDESINEGTSVKKGDYVLYKGNGTKWVKSKIMQVIPSAKKLHIDWNDEYIEVDIKDVKPIKESVNEMKMVHKGKDITKHVLDYMEKKITKAEFEKLTGLKKDKLKVNESVIGDILIIADENNTYEAFTAELVNQKYLMPDELQDPETKEWLETTYAQVHESISLKSLAMEARKPRGYYEKKFKHLKKKPKYKKGDEVVYVQDLGGRDELSPETSRVKKVSKGLTGFKYDLTNYIQTNDSEILGLAESVNEGKTYRLYMNSDPDAPNEIDYERYFGDGDKAAMIKKAKKFAKDGTNQYGDPIKITVTAEDDINDVAWTNESVNEAVFQFPKSFEIKKTIDYNAPGVPMTKLFKGTYEKVEGAPHYTKTSFAKYINKVMKSEVTLDEKDFTNFDRMGDQDGFGSGSYGIKVNEAKVFKKGNKVSYKDDDGKSKTGYIIKKMTKTFRGKKNVQYLIGTAKTTDPKLGRFDTVSSVPGKEADKLKLEGAPYEYDNISEPYSIKVGDMVQNTNPSCPHHGSQGMVKKVMPMPNDVGDLIKYIVMNQGDTYQAGDVLTKTPDQLEVM